MGLKHRVLKCFWQLGGFNLLKVRSNRCARILMYHRFSKEKVPFRISEKTFGEQMALLRDRFNVVRLIELVEIIRNRSEIPRNCVCITIDDGYKDFYLYGYPVLKRHNLPATVFLTTGFIDSERWLWPDKISYVLENANKGNFILRLGKDPERFSIRNMGEILEAQLRIFKHCTSVSNHEKETLIENLAETIGLEVPESPTEDYLGLNWGEIEEMRRNNISFGSHTVSHAILTKLTDEELDNEINASKRIIEDKLNEKVNMLAYPDGKYDKKVVERIRESDYLGAVTTVSGINGTDADVYSLRRIAGSEMPQYYFMRRVFLQK